MKHVVLAGFLLVSSALVAVAGPVEEQLVAGLKAQGYVILEDGYTFFGRLRIVAENATLHREIVVNPQTGEVLRDYAVLLAGDAPSSSGNAVASSSGSNRGSGDSSGSGSGQDATASLADLSTTATSGKGDGTSTGTVATMHTQPTITDPTTPDPTTEVILADPVITLGTATK